MVLLEPLQHVINELISILFALLLVLTVVLVHYGHVLFVQFYIAKCLRSRSTLSFYT